MQGNAIGLWLSESVDIVTEGHCDSVTPSDFLIYPMLCYSNGRDN